MAILGSVNFMNLQNSYYQPQIKTVDVDQIRKQETEQVKHAAESQIASPIHTPEADKARAQRVASLQDISLNFNKNAAGSQIGKDVDIESLDRPTSVRSSGHRDGILQQYQFFVGDKVNAPAPTQDAVLGGYVQSVSPDGIVIQK